ncbi:MAG: AraC family transcriptional regulator [Candidatus Pedobacter colombiensis]|uniref:AraC family transcriptional regulator n=1 Tax=Candidatus Pedobacter colombiensis TaxID=3121371 RepID=A0AAJ5WBJ2_9SPHI|nr:AraC family transcriptional regulator [Pedobacter sp.]WEK20998.1 MAG: AraC family transcriptional regulator [Pedobacter sp.]
MKPQLHKLPLESDSSFLYNKWDCDYFDKPWHFHKEYELVMIDKGKGTKFIGDNVCHFEEGNLSLIGSNIPHMYKNNEEFYAKTGEMEASSIFIHFTKDFLGTHFFEIPEMKLVHRLLDKSSLALDIEGKTKKYTINKLHDMYSEKPTQRLLSLLEILIKLAHSKDLKPLLSTGFSANNNGDTERINKVFEFIIKNYTKEIYVQEIASKLNMSVASFSRYFKHHTHKTFSDYVTEIRIGHACRLLMENNFSISEISYKSGFDNLSNFYRHFKKLRGIIPKEYRSRFLKITR